MEVIGKNHKICRFCVLVSLCAAILLSGCNAVSSEDKPKEPFAAAHENKTKEPSPTSSPAADAVIVVNEAISDSVSTDTKEPAEEGNEQADEKEENMEEAFYITEITDEIFDRIYGKSFKEDCTLPREDLRYLHVLHKDINGIEHEGEMITNYHIAEDLLDIMKELYENDYPIEKIRLVDEYGADDELSMEDNNSSSFNFRFVPRTKKISKHGLGLAVDINTLYNPYITKSDSGLRIEPVNAGEYADRDKEFDYKIEKGDLCYELFISHGFEWGGEWKNSKDYQHFEIPTDKIKEWYPGN